MNGRSRVLAARMVEAVARSYGMDAAVIRGRARTKTIAEARLVAYVVLREELFLSWPEIGRALGGRNHGSVIKGAQRVLSRARANADFRARVEQAKAAAFAVHGHPCPDFVASLVDGRAVDFLEADRRDDDVCCVAGCGWMRALHPKELRLANSAPARRAA